MAKKYHATITEYLNAVLLYALLQKQKEDVRVREKPVKIAMPVNLRRFFPLQNAAEFYYHDLFSGS